MDQKIFQHAAEKLEKEYFYFLDYLNSNQVILAKNTENIGKKDCFAINSQFNIVKERYPASGRTQANYAVIDFFCYFSKETGIFEIVKNKGKGLLLKKSSKYDIFLELSSIEKYALMMTVYMGRYRDSERRLDRTFTETLLFELMKNGTITSVSEESSEYGMPEHWKESYYSEIRLFALFQWIEIEWLDAGEDGGKNKFHIKNVYKTSAGDSLVQAFKRQKIQSCYNIDRAFSIVKDMIQIVNSATKAKFMKFWVNKANREPLTIVFEVSIECCVREIKVSNRLTLDDLHYLIQESVDFDMDHLYLFQIGKGGSIKRYFSPECERGEWPADTVLLADLFFYEGMDFEYLFDFGENWRFSITVKHILQEVIQISEIKEIEGTAPEQYHEY